MFIRYQLWWIKMYKQISTNHVDKVIDDDDDDDDDEDEDADNNVNAN